MQQPVWVVSGQRLKGACNLLSPFKQYVLQCNSIHVCSEESPILFTKAYLQESDYRIAAIGSYCDWYYQVLTKGFIRFCLLMSWRHLAGCCLKLNSGLNWIWSDLAAQLQWGHLEVLCSNHSLRGLSEEPLSPNLLSTLIQNISITLHINHWRLTENHCFHWSNLN